MGLIVLAIAILPLLGVGGRQMFKAESPGPMKDTKLTPRIAGDGEGALARLLRHLPPPASSRCAGPA